jgi:hypothetical protein
MSFSQSYISSRVRMVRLIVLCLVVAVFGVQLAHIVYLQIATFHPMPWADDWDTLFLFALAERAPGTGFGFLFFPHNEHRIAIPRLITLVDLLTARGTGVINLATILIVPALTTVAFWCVLRRRVDMSVLLAGSLACLLFSGGQMSTFLWAFQTQVVLLYFFALLAFYFAARAIETGERRPYFAACIFAVCACLCQSGGLLVLPVILILGAWHWRRSGRAAPLGVAIATALTAAFYVWGPGGRIPSSAALVSIRDQTLFAISFLGSPFVTMASTLVIPAGVIAIGLSILLIVRYRKIAAPRADQTIAVAICLFILAIAAAAALTRVSLGVVGATESRFVTPVIFLWAGLLVGFWPSLTVRSAALCAASVGVYGLLSHVWLQYDYYPLHELKANGEVAYLAGVKDTARLSHFGVPERLWAARPFVIRYALAPFSSAVSQAVDRRLSEVYEVASAPCRGHLDPDLEAIPSNEGFALHGWALSDDGRAPTAVLLVQRDFVTGIGRFVEDRPDVMASDNGARELRVGFVGIVRNLDSPVRAYVAARGAACPLPGEVKPRAPR